MAVERVCRIERFDSLLSFCDEFKNVVAVEKVDDWLGSGS